MSPNIDDLKESRFLTQKEVDPPVLVTIVAYEEVNAAMDGADPQMKWVLNFKEIDKPMPLNSTNGQLIAAITGSGEFMDWIGKQIVLYRDPTISFGGKLVGGIRVRAPKGMSAPDESQETTDVPFEEEYQV